MHRRSCSTRTFEHASVSFDAVRCEGDDHLDAKSGEKGGGAAWKPDAEKVQIATPTVLRPSCANGSASAFRKFVAPEPYGRYDMLVKHAREKAVPIAPPAKILEPGRKACFW